MRTVPTVSAKLRWVQNYLWTWKPLQKDSAHCPRYKHGMCIKLSLISAHLAKGRWSDWGSWQETSQSHVQSKGWGICCMILVLSHWHMLSGCCLSDKSLKMWSDQQITHMCSVCPCVHTGLCTHSLHCSNTTQYHHILLDMIAHCDLTVQLVWHSITWSCSGSCE